MVDAGSVGDNEGGTGISFGFSDGLKQLIGVCTHSYAGNVAVTVGHHHLAQILLAALLAGGLELRHGTKRCGLAALSAGVGVDLRVYHQNVDVLAHGDDVIQTAEADVIGPAVTAVHPHRLFGQMLAVAQDQSLEFVGVAGESAIVQCGGQLFGCGHGCVHVGKGFQPFGDRSLQRGYQTL